MFLLCNLWKSTGRIGLVAWGQNSLFPRWPILLLSHILAWWQLRRDILVAVYPFMTHHFYCGQNCTQECSQAHVVWVLPLVVLAWEAFQRAALFHPRRHQAKGANQTKVLVVWNQVSLGFQQVYPWCISTRLRVRCLSVRDRLSLTREGKLQWKSVYTPIQSREGHLQWKEAMVVGATLFSFTDRSYLFQNHSFTTYFFKKRKKQLGQVWTLDFKKDMLDLLWY